MTTRIPLAALALACGCVAALAGEMDVSVILGPDLEVAAQYD